MIVFQRDMNVALNVYRSELYIEPQKANLEVFKTMFPHLTREVVNIVTELFPSLHYYGKT